MDTVTHSRLAQLAAGLLGYFRWDAAGLSWDSTAAQWLGDCPAREVDEDAHEPAGTAADPLTVWPSEVPITEVLQRARAHPGRELSLVLPGLGTRHRDAGAADGGMSTFGGVLIRGRWQDDVFEAVVMPLPTPLWPALHSGAPSLPLPDIEERVGRVCHELRTPLQALMGHCELALQDWPEQVNAQHLTRIEQSGQRMLHIVNDLLDLTRVETGTLEIQHDQSLNLRAQLARTLLLAEGLRRTCPVSLYASVDPACPVALRGDGARLEQILLNLLSNAIRFTDQGEILLQVRLLRRTADAVSLRVTVADSGIGLPPEELARLKAYAGRTLPSPRRGGSGFGLAVVRGLLELHGATLEIASAQGGGTLMWFDLTYLIDATEPVWVAPTPDRRACVFSRDARLIETLALMWEGQGSRLVPLPDSWLTQPLSALPPCWLVDTAWPQAAEVVALAQAQGVRALCVQARPVAVRHMLAGMPVHSVVRAWDELFPPHAGRALQEDPLLAGRRVLVIEDELLNQAVVSEGLRQLGVQVSLCAQGQEGIHLLRSEAWDAVLLDMHLPDMDGIAVLHSWHALTADQRPPVALVTAHVTESEWQQAQQLGVRQRLLKPYALLELASLMRTLCGHLPRREAVTNLAPSTPANPVLLPRLPDPGMSRDRWLRQVFLQEWPRLRTAVQQALRPVSEAGYDPVALRQAVHALRGALAMMGRGPLLERARHLEEQILAGVWMNEAEVRSFLTLVEDLCGTQEQPSNTS